MTSSYVTHHKCGADQPLTKLHELKKQLRELMPVLKEKYKVATLEIFGSYVRGEQTEKSDVDILVTFKAPYSLWELIDTERFLRRKLRVKVDLVPKDSVKSVLKDRIYSEAAAV
jgi:predicted nucleotidyltransferase